MSAKPAKPDKKSTRRGVQTGRSAEEISAYIKFVAQQSDTEKIFEKTNTEPGKEKDDTEKIKDDGTDPVSEKIINNAKQEKTATKNDSKTNAPRRKKTKKISDYLNLKTLYTSLAIAAVLGIVGGGWFLVRYYISNQIRNYALQDSQVNNKNINYLITTASSTFSKVSEIKVDVDNIKDRIPTNTKN